MQFYYVSSNGQQAGPASVEQLKAAKISADTLVWREGMKEWQPASTVPELKSLFPVVEKKAGQPTPPPLPNPKTVATPPPAAPKTTGQPAAPDLSIKNLKKYGVPAAGILVLLLIAIFFFTRDKKSGNAVAQSLNTDTIQVDKDSGMSQAGAGDTVKNADADTLANKLKWDTTGSTSGETTEADKDVSFLPGFGGDPSATKQGSKKEKKSTTKKSTGKQPAAERDEVTTTREERNEARPQTETKVNPVTYLSISGSFRKNLIFEAVLEGTIVSKFNGQLRNIVIEAWFLDASGQSVGTKRFTQHGPLAASSSIPFRFKTNAPKGAKGVRYEIVSASVN